ncbi:MAG TPA: enolase C-terminal domain-like protein [Candidatus Sumerlaeota bacterium]|nr:enolase C-terminal domain-like protein [Candidatus Sumerlaeota bacterium]
MRIRHFEVFQTALPFRVRFRHAQASRSHSASIFVRCELADGAVGHGEGLPREYVTGESWEGCFQNLTQRILPPLLDCDFATIGEVEAFCGGLYERLVSGAAGIAERPGAACCAAELALLDAYGRHFGATSFAHSGAGSDPVYSGVISSSGIVAAAVTAWRCRRAGVPAVKLKAGTPRDGAVLRVARRILGPAVSLRMDANMGWEFDEARRAIMMARRHAVHYVEQPLARGRHELCRRLADETGARLIADEDLCDLRDAETLVEAGACQVFNIRVSKCGGFFNSLRLGHFARRHGLEVQVGCQVGESALLSAVGLAVARRLAPVVFMEGSFGTRLLVDDLSGWASGHGFAFGPGGRAPRYDPESGIGIALNEAALRRYSVRSCRIG